MVPSGDPCSADVSIQLKARQKPHSDFVIVLCLVHFSNAMRAALGLFGSKCCLAIYVLLGVGVGSDPHPYRPSPIHDPSGEIDCRHVQSCSRNADCDFPRRLCGVGVCPGKVCLHKASFPLLRIDIISMLALFAVAVAAGAAGIGGGGLNVPLLIFLGGFELKEAVPLSHVAVLGNAISQVLVTCRLRHPELPARPLVHYELALLMLPAQLSGSSLGVVVGRVMPPTLLICLALCLLVFASLKTAVRGCKVLCAARRKAEPPCRAAMSRQLQDVALPAPWPTLPAPTSDASLAAVDAHEQMPGRTLSGTFLRVVASARELQGDREVQPEQLPPVRLPRGVLLCLVLFDLVCCMDFMFMSKDVFDIQRCSAIYWIALLALYPFAAGAVFFGVRAIKDLASWHESRGDAQVEGDPPLNATTALSLPLAALIIGLVAGLLGLGGGELLVPLLLEFGVTPRVASATSGLLILLTTASNIVHYMFAGTLEPFLGYSIFFFCVNLAGAGVGLAIVETRFVKSRSYLIVFLVAVLLAISSALLGYRGFVQSDIDWDFQSLCE
eukprot:TRINITY_DN4217_c0_g4_i2.p1 TRINITY_DN4217_c0_g4~~TRINITY_DN4217_c0_g4_i2.p1  ORF type:complete len:555 (+),score=94.34 TRINITY_DN4217_c0_g4_i2:29-1693(+)